MARRASQTISAVGASVGVRRAGVMVVILATVWPATSANATPLLAQAGAALVAPPLDKAAKPVNPVANVPGAKMAENFANAPAGGAPAAAAAAAPATGASGAGGSNALMKYGPSYVLMLLAIGLGTFIICRPKPSAATKTAAK
jgi:hypothetical protein